MLVEDMQNRCTEFVPTDFQIPNLFESVNESLFTAVANIAIKQGKLLCCVNQDPQETWKEEYFLLTVDRLWYHSLKASESERQMSYYEFGDDTVCQLLPPTTISIVLRQGLPPILLKAKSRDEAENWVSDVVDRKTSSDNEFIAAIDNIVVEREMIFSTKDFDRLNQIFSFEGMLKNR